MNTLRSSYLIISVFTLFLIFSGASSALIINSIDTTKVSPGEEVTVSIEVENNLNDDVEDVSLSLDFENLPFIPVGTSTQSEEKIKGDDEENFLFRIKSSSQSTPGDYEIPYTLQYSHGSVEKIERGTIGLSVLANPEIDFVLSSDNAVYGRKGDLELKIINKGFSDARFVSLKVNQEGLSIISEDSIYIGTIDSDDFESVNLEVDFNSLNPTLFVMLEYRDFENKIVRQNAEIPVKVYTVEQATNLGIVKKNNFYFYVPIVFLVILLIILYRILRKRQRLKRIIRKE